MKKIVAILALALVLAIPARGLEESEADKPSPFSAAGWCSVTSGHSEEAYSGCDLGIGAALARWNRLAWVGVVGRETIGTGVAWIASDGSGRLPAVAVSLGVIAPWSDEGVRVDRWAPAIGATFGFGSKH